jgi:hypothetical protein
MTAEERHLSSKPITAVMDCGRAAGGLAIICW